MTRRRGRRRKKLLDDLKERRGYCQLKEEALDRTMWRNRFGRGFGRVVWQITDDDHTTSESLAVHFLAPVDNRRLKETREKNDVKPPPRQGAEILIWNLPNTNQGRANANTIDKRFLIYVIRELISLIITGTDGSSSGSGRHERFGWYCILRLYRNSNIPCAFSETKVLWYFPRALLFKRGSMGKDRCGIDGILPSDVNGTFCC